MRRHGGSIIGAIALLIAVIFAVLYFTKDDARNVSYTTPAASAANGSSKKQDSGEQLAASRTHAASATSNDEKRKLWVIVRDRTGSKQKARVALIRSTGEGTYSQMTGTVGQDGYVTFNQHGQDLEEGSYQLVVSKSLGSGYTRDYHSVVTVKGSATTVTVTYKKMKSRTVVSCVVKRGAPKNRGAQVTYRPPSGPSSSPAPTGRPKTHAIARGKGQAIAKAQATGTQAQASAQSATITQRQSGSCGKNCAVSNNANANINQQSQQQQTSVGGSGSGTSTASGSARASSGNGKSDCVAVATGSVSVSTCP